MTILYKAGTKRIQFLALFKELTRINSINGILLLALGVAMLARIDHPAPQLLRSWFGYEGLVFYLICVFWAGIDSLYNPKQSLERLVLYGGLVLIYLIPATHGVMTRNFAFAALPLYGAWIITPTLFQLEQTKGWATRFFRFFNGRGVYRILFLLLLLSGISGLLRPTGVYEQIANLFVMPVFIVPLAQVFTASYGLYRKRNASLEFIIVVLPILFLGIFVLLSQLEREFTPLTTGIPMIGTALFALRSGYEREGAYHET